MQGPCRLELTDLPKKDSFVRSISTSLCSNNTWCKVVSILLTRCIIALNTHQRSPCRNRFLLASGIDRTKLSRTRDYISLAVRSLCNASSCLTYLVRNRKHAVYSPLFDVLSLHCRSAIPYKHDNCSEACQKRQRQSSLEKIIPKEIENKH